MTRVSKRRQPARAGRGAAGAVALSALLGAPGALAETPPETEGDPQQAPPRSAVSRPRLAPEFRLHGFADFSYVAESAAAGDHDAFALGELELHVISRLTERLSFLGEVVFEVNEHDQTQLVDVERVVLKYTHSDRLWVSVGRHHTPLGYWNETYHHGLLLQPTIERPAALKFEDDGGVLPVHQVGVEAGGTVFRGPWALDYVGLVSNGRGTNRIQVQGGGDADDSKAYGVKLSLARETTRRIRFGPMLYVDRIPPAGTPGRGAAIDERVVGLHLAFRSDHVELLSEVHRMRHEDRVSGRRFTHPSGYAVLIWRPWRIKPYVGLDRLDLDRADPFFPDVGPIRRRLAGVRFDPNPFFALKLELRRDERAGMDVDALAIQAAYTF